MSNSVIKWLREYGLPPVSRESTLDGTVRSERSLKDTGAQPNIAIFPTQRDSKLWFTEPTSTSTSMHDLTGDELGVKFEKELLECLDSDFIEPGVKSATEYFVEKWLSIHPVLVQTSLGRIYLGNTSDTRRIVGILTVVAHLDKQALSPANELIALGSLAHTSVEVKEFALRAYEYWEDTELVARLKNFEMQPKWLDDYRKEIIMDVCGA